MIHEIPTGRHQMNIFALRESDIAGLMLFSGRDSSRPD